MILALAPLWPYWKTFLSTRVRRLRVVDSLGKGLPS